MREARFVQWCKTFTGAICTGDFSMKRQYQVAIFILLFWIKLAQGMKPYGSAGQMWCRSNLRAIWTLGIRTGSPPRSGSTQPQLAPACQHLPPSLASHARNRPWGLMCQNWALCLLACPVELAGPQPMVLQLAHGKPRLDGTAQGARSDPQARGLAPLDLARCLE